MQIQQETEHTGGELPEAQPSPERAHRIEKGGRAGQQRKKQIEQGRAQPPEPASGRTQEIVDRAERQPQYQRPEQLQELHARVDRHAQPKSRDQRPPLRAGSS